MADAFIIDAVPHPSRGIGKQGKGALAHLHPQHLGRHRARRRWSTATASTPSDVDDVVWGTSSQVSEQAGDLGRMAALDAGYDVKASGVTLDRFCGSGITSANHSGRDHGIMAGMEDLVDRSGGTEMMSLPKKGLLPMGCQQPAPSQEIHPQPHQGVCADAIATTRGHLARRARRPRRRVPGPRRPRHPPRAASTSSLITGATTTTVQRGAGSRRVPAPRHHGRVARRSSSPSFPAVADYRHDESTPTFRELIGHAVPRPRHRARAPRRQLAPVSSTVPAAIL